MATPSRAAKQPAATAASGASTPQAPRDAASTGRAAPLRGAELFAERVAALGLRVELPRGPAAAPGLATTPSNPLGSGPGPPGELPALFEAAGPGSGDPLDFELEPGSAAASPNSDDLAAECSASLSLSSPDSAARSALGLAPGEAWDPESTAEGWQAAPAVQAAVLPRRALKLLIAGYTPESVACCDPAWHGALFLEYLGFRLRERSRYSFAADSRDLSPGSGSTPRSPPQPCSSAGGGIGSAERRAGNGGSGAGGHAGANQGGFSPAAGRDGSGGGAGGPDGSDAAVEGACAEASVRRPSPAGGLGEGAVWGCEGRDAATAGAGAGASAQQLNSANGGGSSGAGPHSGSGAVTLETGLETSVQHPGAAAAGGGGGGDTRSGSAIASAPAATAAPGPAPSSADPVEPHAHTPPVQTGGISGPPRAGAAQPGGADGAAADPIPGTGQEGARALVTLQAPGGKPAAKPRRQPPLRVRRAAKPPAAGADPGGTPAATLAPAMVSSRADPRAGEPAEAPAAAPPADALAEQLPPLQHAEAERAGAQQAAAELGQGAGAPAGQPDERSAPVVPGQSAPALATPELAGTHGGASGPPAKSKTLEGPEQGGERGDGRAVQDTGAGKEPRPAAATTAEQHRQWWLPAPMLEGDAHVRERLPPPPAAGHSAADQPTRVWISDDAARTAAQLAKALAEVPTWPKVFSALPQPAGAGDAAQESRGTEAGSAHEGGGRPPETRHATPPVVPLPQQLAGAGDAARKSRGVEAESAPEGVGLAPETRHATPPVVPLPQHIVVELQEADGGEAAQACGAPRPPACALSSGTVRCPTRSGRCRFNMQSMHTDFWSCSQALCACTPSAAARAAPSWRPAAERTAHVYCRHSCRGRRCCFHGCGRGSTDDGSCRRRPWRPAPRSSCWCNAQPSAQRSLHKEQLQLGGGRRGWPPPQGC